MLQDEHWRAYFYPETYSELTGSGTLINNYGERDRHVVGALETGAVTKRAKQILRGDVPIVQTFGAAHVQAIHHWLFQDVYSWAGELRLVEAVKGDAAMTRGQPYFAGVDGGVEAYLTAVSTIVNGTEWDDLSRAGFVEASSMVFAYLHFAHPFRVGNGRTAKVFMHDVAKLSPFRLDFDRIDPEDWNNAAMWCGPLNGTSQPRFDELFEVFDAATASAEA